MTSYVGNTSGIWYISSIHCKNISYKQMTSPIQTDLSFIMNVLHVKVWKLILLKLTKRRYIHAVLLVIFAVNWKSSLITRFLSVAQAFWLAAMYKPIKYSSSMQVPRKWISSYLFALIPIAFLFYWHWRSNIDVVTLIG